ncbi:mannose-1-phosphate guanylyltransferase/mannose-6-phosphate isomerase [Sphingomonas sp. LHG3406-1]|uniref:mannose-1-phosphate guanylyltransferase/mannose-6-phosphate isomerase n=1 Tax=Sphingomonas sp. LHG3406-1 TaxID=2804617 RepID=UPI002611CA2A|nr:mannose-1-phosphate guanylyltransferase/mannose-6-phosphate isomerase [Sphingomonas sp. LHG3406-1]
MTSIRPVILSGGSGTRLWPISRESFPKQLLPISTERTMLQETALRVTGTQFREPIVIAGEDHRFFIQRQLEQSGVPVEAILLEPKGRNTAAAAVLAAIWSLDRGEDDLLLLLPSDHMIEDQQAFAAAVESGIAAADQGGIVTFGARPTEPNTQYGYIEVSEDGPGIGEARPVRRFIEKPDRQTAEDYLSRGGHYWNSGIFLFRASSLRDEAAKLMPELVEAVSRSLASKSIDGKFVRPEREAFEAAPNISIDYGIMEKTARAFVVPVDMAWSDVGSWGAVWQLADKDADDNALQGDIIAIDTSESIIRAEGSVTVAAVGLQKMAVIAARDAVFIAPVDRAADVREVVDQLKRDKRDLATLPSRVERPWGSYETKDRGSRFQIKHILVAPGETLSLQMHYHRSEHWVVVSGTAEVTVGDKIQLLQENQSTYIPAGTTHRLANPGKVPLELVEVQCGPYLGEDDIVRFDDEYGRA